MKQLYIQTTTQHPMSIGDVFSVKNQSNIRRNSNRLAILSPKQSVGETRRGKPAGQGEKLCKGPPGRPRSPGLFPEHPPVRLGWSDGPDGGIPPDRVPNPVGGNTPRNTEIQFFKNNKFNFYSRLNFTTMKKQILFLAFFILAVLASITDSYGQMPASTIGTESATCTSGGKDSPLNPKPGKAYNYSVNIGNTGAITGVVSDYLWWATKNPQFVIGTTTPTTSPNWADRLTVGGGLIAAGANYGQATGGTATMSITWSPSTLALTEYQGAGSPPAKSPTFVAVMAKGACADNIQVWEINPMPAFTVDITNFDRTKTVAENYGNTISSCVSPVVSATYNTGTKKVDMDYGLNTLYFEVVSANFVGSWTPTITVDGLSLGETASATIHYSYAGAIAGTGVIETLNFPADGTTVVGTTALGSTVSDTSSGVSFWLALTVDHNKYETLAASTIRVTIDGMDTTGQWDLLNNCDDAAGPDDNDYAEQVITPRPDIQDIINDPLYNSIAPDTFIPKPNP